MKLAVTDACIFIDLYELRLTSYFFSLPLEIHTTFDVFSELDPEQQELLSAYRSSGKLQTHIISGETRMEILSQNFPAGLTMNDRTVLFVAGRIGAMVLSSDKLVRKTAGRSGIEYHGVIWIIDRLVTDSLITKKEGVIKLEELLRTNSFYFANIELAEQLAKRINLWSERL